MELDSISISKVSPCKQITMQQNIWRFNGCKIFIILFIWWPIQLGYLNWFAKENSGISHLNSPSCFSMSTISYKTKTFISLYADVFNNTSTKKMEMLVEISWTNLQNIIHDAVYEKHRACMLKIENILVTLGIKSNMGSCGKKYLNNLINQNI